jgi:hypothetical protein
VCSCSVCVIREVSPLCLNPTQRPAQRCHCCATGDCLPQQHHREHVRVCAEQAEQAQEFPVNRSFRRVKSEEWLGKKGSMANSYEATFGNEGWGAKAQQVLGQTRGKGFRHEKTKKKRGNYMGGKIDCSARASFKYDSD